MKRLTKIAVPLVTGVALGLGLWAVPRQSLVAFFVTPDQQGDWQLRHGHAKEAAARYTDPLRQGVAWYQAGEFEKAARAFSRVPVAPGAFNEGNAWLMRGAYDKAIAAYERALALQPGWTLAEDNRALALARRDRLKKEGGDVTGGQVQADETVFDLNRKGGQDTTAEGNAPLSDADLDALWLRRVQTTPGDFLRAKFAYQAAQRDKTP
jgi:Ca-activated chloride channel homolog